MLKNAQFKIMVIFLIIGLVIIGGLGIYFLNTITYLNENILNLENLENVNQLLVNIQSDIIRVLIIVITVFIIIGILISIYLSRYVILPMNKLIDTAKSERINVKSERKKVKKVDNFENVFGLMTSELKEKLREVSTQKNQIETILLHMTDGIIAFNMQGEIILINPAAKKFLSIAPEDEMFEDVFKKFELNINMEKIIYLESWTSTNERIESEKYFLNVFFAPFKDEDGRPNGVIAVIQDITEHVKLDNMQKELVADVSHELKTPITSIMGYSDTLLEGDYDKETQEKFLSVIASEARRMAKLVTDLLTLSRYDSNKNQTNKEKFDLGDLVKKCQDKLAIEIQKKEQIVNTFVTAEVPEVFADRYDIERVVLNILSNSIKYTPKQGEIKIYVGFVYNDAYIKIFDNGIGIPEEDLNRIFERFYRVDKARTREMGGTGLGLAIAKEILDKNAGSINIKSVVGQGTEVVIRIPTVSNQE